MAHARWIVVVGFAGVALLVTGSGRAAAIDTPTLPPLPTLPTPLPTPTASIPNPVPSLPGTGSIQLPGTSPTAPQQDSPPEEQQRQQYEQQQADVQAQMPAYFAQYGAQALQLSANDGPFSWPEVTTTISQPFGCTEFLLEPTNPACATKHWHTGLDIVGPNGSPVFASASGVARTFPGSVGYGNFVVIIHSDQYATLYGHLGAFAIKDGDEVKKGDLIGLEGSTGFSTGPHLHFEIRHANDYVDPLPFFLAHAGPAGALPPTGSPAAPAAHREALLRTY